MNDTLEFLEDYFSTAENVLIQNKIQLLRAQIDFEILKAKLENLK